MELDPRRNREFLRLIYAFSGSGQVFAPIIELYGVAMPAMHSGSGATVARTGAVVVIAGGIAEGGNAFLFLEFLEAQ